MKFRTLIAAFLLCAALAALLYWSNRRESAQDSASAAANASSKVLSLDPQNITRLEISKTGAEPVIVTRNPAGKWKLTSSGSLDVDEDALSSVLSTLASLDSVRLLEEKVGDLKPFGLADPPFRVTAATKDGKTHKLLIGDDTPTGQGTYAKLDGDPRLFLVATSTKASLDKNAPDLRNTLLLPLDFTQISRMELHGPNLEIAFGRVNGDWVLHEPKNVRVDSSKMEAVIQRIKGAKIDYDVSSAQAKTLAAAFAAATRLGTIKGTDEYGSEELEIRRSKDVYYAKPTAVAGVYKLSNDLGKDLEKNLEDFLERMIFNMGPEYAEKVELRNGDKVYSLTHRDTEWRLDGKKMNQSSVEFFVDWTRRLTSKQFVQTGYGAPTIEITLTYRSGSQVEKAGFVKSGENYIAKRENEPALYLVEGESMNALLKAAEEMKPDAK